MWYIISTMKSNLTESIQNVSGNYIVAKQSDNYRYDVKATLVNDEIIVNVGDYVNEKVLKECYYSIFELASNSGYGTVVVEVFQGAHNYMDLKEVKQIIDDILFESFRKLKVYILVDYIDTGRLDVDFDKLHKKVDREISINYTEREVSHTSYGMLGMMVSSSSNRRRKKSTHTYEELINLWIEGKNTSNEELCERSGIHIDDFNGYDNTNLPSKDELLAMAIALGLNVEETEQLLDTCNYRFGSSRRYTIIKTLIDDGYNIKHNVDDLNTVLNKEGFDGIC